MKRYYIIRTWALLGLVMPLAPILAAQPDFMGPTHDQMPVPEPVVIDPMQQAREAMARNDPAEALARYLRVLARNPADLEALSGAGDAALAVGDADAAINFYVRAQEIAPTNGLVKAGLAMALVQKEQPRAALKLFDEALALGVPLSKIAADRGLAYDLRGDFKRAQADYAIAFRTRNDPEITARMALSLAIGGDRAAALAVLDPLLRRQDVSAWRARAFVLALTGDAVEAERAAFAVLPRPQAEMLKPFLEKIGSLKPAEKAAAVHFGHFPADKLPPPMLVVAKPKPLPPEISSTKTGPVEPVTFDLNAPKAIKPGGDARPKGMDVPKLKTSKPVAGPPPSLELADLIDTSNTPKPGFDALASDDGRRTAKDRKAADARKQAEEKRAKAEKDKEAKAARDAKAKDANAEKPKGPQRYWVQISGGAYKPDLPKAYAKLKAKWGKQLAGKTPWTMPFRNTNRILIGPFKSADAAQDYVNEVAGAGLETFRVTTSAADKVERLGS